MLGTSQFLDHLFGAFEAQVEPPDHQDRCHRPRRKFADRQCRRQQHQQLVAQAALGDRPDDRQFALRSELSHIGRGHRSIVDHYPGSFRASFGCRRADIVERCGCQLGNHGYVVEKCDQTRWHC